MTTSGARKVDDVAATNDGRERERDSRIERKEWEKEREG